MNPSLFPLISAVTRSGLHTRDLMEGCISPAAGTSYLHKLLFIGFLHQLEQGEWDRFKFSVVSWMLIKHSCSSWKGRAGLQQCSTFITLSGRLDGVTVGKEIPHLWNPPTRFPIGKIPAIKWKVLTLLEHRSSQFQYKCSIIPLFVLVKFKNLTKNQLVTEVEIKSTDNVTSFCHIS